MSRSGLLDDAGKSEFTNLDNVMKDGKDQGELFAEITEKSGFDKASTVGATEGGFIATSYALYFLSRRLASLPWHGCLI